MTEPSNASAHSPSKRMCPQHNLQLAPDGKCALCRRLEAPPEPSGPTLGSIIMSNLAIVAIGLSLMYMLTAKPPDERPTGPAIEAQIEVVDAQIAELVSLRNSGQLNADGLQALTRLENKRALFERIRVAKERNAE